MDVLERLVARRKRLGLSQSDVSDRMGIGQSRVSVIESGAHDLLPGSLAEYAQAVEAAISYLVIPKELLHTTEVRALVDEMEKLFRRIPDPETIESVLQFVESLEA